ncbi:MAG: GumC family protein [Candidatus Zhuqueibacterota bacterium]
MEKRKITTLDYLSILVKWRKMIIINSLIFCFFVAVVSLIIPKYYTATATIMPPTSESSDLGLSSLLSKIPGGSFTANMGLVSEETNTFLAILNSRSVMQNVIEKFNLIQRFKSKNIEEAVRTLSQLVVVKVNDEGTISLSMKINTPFFAGKTKEREAAELAKDIANYFLIELDRVNRELKTDKARSTRIFIERRYHQNLVDLIKAEDDFRSFQIQYGAISLPEQVEVGITAAAELKAQIISKQVELGVMKKYLSESHQEFMKTQSQLQELESKYNDFRYGTKLDKNNSINSQSLDLFPPFSDIPDLGIQYARLYREVKLQETLLEFILPQYEQAKIQEAKDTPTVQVLDKAIAPIKRSSPKRMLLVLASGIISLLFFSMMAYIAVNLEYIKQSDSNRYSRIQQIFVDLKPNNWFRK